MVIVFNNWLAKFLKTDNNGFLPTELPYLHFIHCKTIMGGRPGLSLKQISSHSALLATPASNRIQDGLVGAQVAELVKCQIS